VRVTQLLMDFFTPVDEAQFEMERGVFPASALVPCC
jgi:hypothetical protein